MMWCKWISFVLVAILCFYSSTADKIKIGIVSGPGSERRQNSEKFWSFGQNYSSTILLEPLVQEIRWWSALEVATAVCKLAKNGARALVVDAPSRLCPLIASYSDDLRLLLITGMDAVHRPLGRFQMSVLPETTGAASSLMRHYGWQQPFAFIYDTDTGPDQLHEIYQGMDPMPQVEPFFRAYTADDAFAFLQKLPLTINRVLLATSEELADELFLKLASSTRSTHGILLKPVGTVREIVNRGRWKLTKFSIVEEGSRLLKDFENRWKTLEGWVQRNNVKELPDSALVNYDASKVLYSVFGQMATENPEALSTSVDITSMNCFNYSAGLPESVSFKQNTIATQGVTGSIQFSEGGRRVGFSLNIVETTPFSSKKIGTWSDGAGLRMVDAVPQRRRNVLSPVAAFQTSLPPIRVASILNMPFLRHDKDGNLEGYVIDFLDELMNVIDRRYELHLVSDRKYGIFRDGKWNGMVGELVNNLTDMAMADLTKTPERAKVLDFSKNFMTLGLNILIKKPEGTQSIPYFGPFSFLTVWSVEVWMSLLLLVALFGSLCYVTSRFIGSPDRIRALESKGTDNLSPCGSFWFTIGTLLQRDTGIYPRSLTHRLWSVLWWTCCFFLLINYVSSLTADFIRTRQTITTTHSRKSSHELLEDALQRGFPVIGTLKSGSTNNFFMNSNVGLYEDFGRYLMLNQDVMTNTYAEGTERVKQSKDGSYGYIMESQSSEYIANQPPCDTMVSTGYLTTRSYAPALRKNSTLKELVDHGVLSLMESGILRRLYEKWWHNFTNYCEDPHMDILPKVYNNSMTLHEVSGVFFILCIFAVVSAAAALIEHCISSKRISLD